jgi:hypothetical protein
MGALGGKDLLVSLASPFETEPFGFLVVLERKTRFHQAREGRVAGSKSVI